MTVWFTADTHFGHSNIIRFCNRPFGDIEEHDEALIANWNAVVQPADTVYHLGDFAFRSAQDPNSYAKRLNGKKFLLLGNHDNPNRLPKEHFTVLGHYYELKQKDFDTSVTAPPGLILCHYPFASWARAFHGSYHLFGHVHGRSLEYDKNSLRMDVGVDAHHFYPVSYAEIKTAMQAKGWVRGKRDGALPMPEGTSDH